MKELSITLITVVLEGEASSDEQPVENQPTSRQRWGKGQEAGKIVPGKGYVSNNLPALKSAGFVAPGGNA